MVFAAGCVISGSAVDGYMIGDADGDGAITSLDATTIQRVITVMIPDDDGKIRLRGDVNEDGLSLPDVTVIQRYLAGYDDRTRIGKIADDIRPCLPTEDNQLPIL